MFRHGYKVVSIVKEIFAVRHEKQYRILSLVGSTETSSVGKGGPVFEIVKWNGPYWPSKVIYQLTADQVYFAYLGLDEG